MSSHSQSTSTRPIDSESRKPRLAKRPASSMHDVMYALDVDLIDTSVANPRVTLRNEPRQARPMLQRMELDPRPAEPNTKVFQSMLLMPGSTLHSQAMQTLMFDNEYFIRLAPRHFSDYKKQKQMEYHNANSMSGPANIQTKDISLYHCDEKALLCSNNVLDFWVLDSGSSAYMTSRQELLSSIRPANGKVTLVNSHEVSITGIGTLCLSLKTSEDKDVYANVDNVLSVPELKGENLVSESKLEKVGCTIFSQKGC
ncbi:hypothetical protein GcM1_157011 [Golovinomyces cichoracearum]|uniref:Retrovirus-related Pol polyprotein from transposon TNT 1-94-like beta-barrel domain-containing protein n=1 Tax=Golovinomyces cichoracearum TaxID=62708 RepID=A0A420JA11_9PEZI|nr:hypothetical protein GcM1_157011 [Golovinomyces cichoracearum]